MSSSSAEHMLRACCDVGDNGIEMMEKFEWWLGRFCSVLSARSNASEMHNEEWKRIKIPLKNLLNGQLFILRDGKTYTIQGQEVK